MPPMPRRAAEGSPDSSFRIVLAFGGETRPSEDRRAGGNPASLNPAIPRDVRKPSRRRVREDATEIGGYLPAVTGDWVRCGRLEPAGGGTICGPRSVIPHIRPHSTRKEGTKMVRMTNVSKSTPKAKANPN